MRLGVIDVGSNTVHLLVVDAHHGGPPLPAMSHKRLLRLSEHVDDAGLIDAAGADDLVRFVAECTGIAADQGTEDLLPFATSALREAPNGEEVLQRVRSETGVALQVLSGEDEARLTFLAARRWAGWSAGKLLVVDIGGGSLELSVGTDEEPDVATSLMLGAGRVTRDLLQGDPPTADQVKDVRRQVRATLARDMRPFSKHGTPDTTLGTSKTMRSLARLTGAAPSGDGPFVERSLALPDLTELIGRLTPMSSAQRTRLPGVSEARAHQVLAGALVAEAAMDLLGVTELQICPWAMREGVILRFLDTMEESGHGLADLEPALAT